MTLRSQPKSPISSANRTPAPATTTSAAGSTTPSTPPSSISTSSSSASSPSSPMSTSPASPYKPLAGFDAILALYAHETSPVTTTIPDLSHSSIYHETKQSSRTSSISARLPSLPDYHETKNSPTSPRFPSNPSLISAKSGPARKVAILANPPKAEKTINSSKKMTKTKKTRHQRRSQILLITNPRPLVHPLGLAREHLR
nr:hyccin [Ipomoea batatas]